MLLHTKCFHNTAWHVNFAVEFDYNQNLLLVFIVLNDVFIWLLQIHREFQRLSEGIGLKIQYIQKATTAAKKLGPTSTKKCGNYS